jgi:hypothetical protein
MNNLKYEEITVEDIELIEDKISMGSHAWDMVDPRELALACFEVISKKIENGDFNVGHP